MIGELKSREVRTVREQKVLRVKVDIPYSHAKDAKLTDEDLLEWLDRRVGNEVGFNFTTLENEGQATLEMTKKKD